MSEITKNALANSLKELLSRKIFSKLTVKNITDECGFDRQTFYYYFKDIPDSFEWIYKNELIDKIEGKATYSTWKEAYLYIFQYFYENKIFIKNTYNLLNLDFILYFLTKQINQLLANVINEKDKENKLSEENKKFICTFYGYSLSGMILNWVKSDMKEKPENIVEKVGIIIDGDFIRAIERLSK